MLVYLELSNTNYIKKNRIIGAKINNQEGNSPDWRLRSVNNTYIKRFRGFI
jgi:hypothetical protein